MPLLTRKRKSHIFSSTQDEISSRNSDDSMIENSPESDAVMVFNSQQSSRSQSSVMSFSNKVNVMPSPKRVRDASPDDFENRISSQKMAGKRRRVSTNESARKRKSRMAIVEEDLVEEEHADTTMASDVNDSEEEEEAQDSRVTVEQSDSDIEEPNTFGIPFNGEITATQMLNSNTQFVRCLQQQQEQDSKRVQCLEGEPGHLQRISLENFMCHENFTVDLGLFLFYIFEF